MTSENEIVKERFAVFIAKDTEEYCRYQDDALLPIQNQRVSGQFAVRESGRIVLLLMPEVKSYGAMNEVCHRVSAAILSVVKAKGTIKEQLSALNENEKVKLYIHWGGDCWRDKELSAGKELLTYGAFKKWSVFALSSQRPELWNVGPGKITLPKDDADFRRLEQGSLFSVAKDELTNCIWQWFGTEKAKRSGVNAEFSPDVYRRLGAYLKLLADNMKVACQKEDRWRIDALQSWKDVVESVAGGSNLIKVPLNEKIIALFAELIEKKGVYV